MSLEASEFDILLRSALLEAQRQDWMGILEGEGREPLFSEGYLVRRERFLSTPFTYAGRVARPLWRRAVKTAACILLALGISAGGILAVSPDARAWVEQVVFRWFEDHFDFRFVGTRAGYVRAYDFEPSYLPDGFEIIERDDPDDEYCTTVYGNDAGDVIYFDRGMDVVLGDDEHSTFREITVSGNTAMLEIADEPGSWNAVVWTDDSAGLMFQLLSTYDHKELIKIAESVTYMPK